MRLRGDVAGAVPQFAKIATGACCSQHNGGSADVGRSQRRAHTRQREDIGRRAESDDAVERTVWQREVSSGPIRLERIQMDGIVGDDGVAVGLAAHQAQVDLIASASKGLPGEGAIGLLGRDP